MISPQLFCQIVKRELVTLGWNCLPKSSFQRRLSPIDWCLLDDPWNVTPLPERSPTTFENELDWALMLAETLLKVSRWTNGQFWLWISFFASEKWDSKLLCYFCSLKRIENIIVALILSTNVTFLILEVCLRQTEKPVTVFLIWFSATSFTWNSGHIFLPRFLFQLWSQISSSRRCLVWPGGR